MPLILFLWDTTVQFSQPYVFPRGSMERLADDRLVDRLIEAGAVMNIEKRGCPLDRTVDKIPVLEFINTLNPPPPKWQLLELLPPT